MPLLYPQLLIFVALSGCVAVIFVRCLLSPKPIPGIPHRPITSILGDIPELGKAASSKEAVVPAFFEKYAKELGPIYQVFIGPTVLVVISDIYEIEDLFLRSRCRFLEACDSTVNIFGGVTPNGQVALKMNDLWKKHRRLGGPGMSVKYLKHMWPRISNGAQTLVTYWKKKMPVVRQQGGKCFDVLHDFQMCTMDAIAEIAFGEEHSSIKDALPLIHVTRCVIDSYGGATFPDINGTSLHQAINRHMNRINSMFNVPPFLIKFNWFLVRQTSAFKKDDRLIRRIIGSRISQAKQRVTNVVTTGGSDIADCVLDLIIEKEVKEGTQPYKAYKDYELVDEMANYVFAGYDTTASALAFGVKFLMNHPLVQIKLHDELVSNLSGPRDQPVSYDDVSTGDKTPYLEAVVTSLQDMTILGKSIPKGTELLFLTGFGGMQATKSWGAAKAEKLPSFNPTKGFWGDENARDFVPERWLVDDGDGRRVFSSKQGYSVPFGLGAKGCFGQRLAVLELKVILATISLSFFLEKVPEELNGTKVIEHVARKPVQCYLSLLDWEDVKQRL